ncbi:hypothetical protein KPH14_006097 [Odynerus spinipes]|uniref:Uncharacterized protein n=1 Tax=Odynerus spinipes TaxID=1348599 RepID=A0AAD9RJQ1_9HYME|nr:hypothetical protein KPH14_006097 [Odynerus spinipes]
MKVEALLIKNDEWIYIDGEYKKLEVTVWLRVSDWSTKEQKARSDLILLTRWNCNVVQPLKMSMQSRDDLLISGDTEAKRY